MHGPLIYGPRYGSDAFATEGILSTVGRINPDMRRVVEEQRLCFEATICEDGTANLSPKGTVTVLDDDHLMFADLASPQTVRTSERTLRSRST
jgi:predicted pyridoxine 5'-phosphate oxidase superfamily flavin-nucleotide-binding protein